MEHMDSQDRPQFDRVERSAGLLVFRITEEGWRWLLVQKWNRKWEFPKGKIEPAESEWDAAVRETTEEAGIRDLHPVPGFQQTIRYQYRFRGQWTDKTVVFFLAETHQAGGWPSSEHRTVDWFTAAQALRLLAYDDLKELLVEAVEFLHQQEYTGQPCGIEPVANADSMPAG